ncbi:uncharacterized protein EMH_0100110 [Eimeria mitis]|uniref:Uncharacterized protein n=1 Tax=Eimeria mitis TaxID=44415 RepID=U6KJS9_9EIME|nr:uncharacterized protein EMH_0100110 [Eimeria mitis]CDJ35708.1 hypothetical protein, conserved [Eimeria mitis]
MKLREVYAATAAAAAAGKPDTLSAAAAAAGLPLKGSSSYQLRHERNLWIELFCLVLWLFVWRAAKLMGRHWQRIEALKAEVALLQHERQVRGTAAAAAAAAADSDDKNKKNNKHGDSKSPSREEKEDTNRYTQQLQQQQQQQQQ